MNSGKVLLGLLAGVAAGATLGILFAPEKGTTTRRKIVQKGDDYASGLGEKFNDFIDSVTQKFEDLRDEASRAAQNGYAKAEEVAHELVSEKRKVSV